MFHPPGLVGEGAAGDLALVTWCSPHLDMATWHHSLHTTAGCHGVTVSSVTVSQFLVSQCHSVTVYSVTVSQCHSVSRDNQQLLGGQTGSIWSWCWWWWCAVDANIAVSLHSVTQRHVTSRHHPRPRDTAPHLLANTD